MADVCHLFIMLCTKNWRTPSYVSNNRFFVEVCSSIGSPVHIAAHRLIPLVIDFVIKKL
jgi:hypothetical protein